MPVLKKKPTSSKPTKTATNGEATSSEKKLKYPDVTVSICKGEKSITGAQAMRLLGWHEETENAKNDGTEFGSEYLFKDTHGNKIQCLNNLINRPIYVTVVERLKQSMLRKTWCMNGEPIIVGQTGKILNGQHSLVALVEANQIWDDKPGQFRDFWKTPPVMEKLIVYGIEESDAVVNTMDTCKPRSLTDVFYRSEFFKDIAPTSRKKLAKMADHCVKLMWHRTGAADAFRRYRTHDESLDFMNRHPRLLECLKHIYEEHGKERRLAPFLTPGYSAAMLYLMGSSSTERETEDKTGYSDVSNPNESLLTWDLWEQAQEFWVLLAGGDKALFPITQVIGQLIEQNTCGPYDRIAVIVKAWLLWSAEEKLTPENLMPAYKRDDNGWLSLAELPMVGGIDLGEPVPA